MENLTLATGVPTWVSMPHFYQGDPKLAAAIEGMRPDKDTHETYLDIEPETGLLCRAKKRIQLNYFIGNWTSPTLDQSADVLVNDLCSNYPVGECFSAKTLVNCLSTPTTWNMQNDGIYFPVAWAEEAITLDKSDADDLKNSVYFFHDFAYGFRFWAILISALFFIIFITLSLNDKTLENNITDNNDSKDKVNLFNFISQESDDEDRESIGSMKEPLITVI